jgi:hypothetical protein
MNVTVDIIPVADIFIDKYFLSGKCDVEKWNQGKEEYKSDLMIFHIVLVGSI